MRNTFLPYCRPDLGEEEVAAVAACIRNGWLTTGPKAQAFEAAFAKAAGAKHAIAVNSCTAALHIGLIAAGVGPGDEVVTPSLTFVAGAQCTMELGATPVFCDVDEETLTADLQCLQAAVTPTTKAIIVTPYAGRPVHMADIVAFARERGIAVIEDAAHATGMLDRGLWAGALSDLAAFSFYATKNVTTGEGGMLVTNSEDVADRVRVLALHGMDKDAWKRYTARGSWQYDVREPGFKYNMTDIAAAMGIVQLQRLEDMQTRREEIAQRYIAALADLPGIAPQRQPDSPGDRHAWCMFVVRVNEGQTGISRNELIEELKQRNVGASVHYIPTHTFSAYRHLDHPPLPVTERVAQQILSLPLYPNMTDADVDDVIDALTQSLRRTRTVAR
jgi:dTDP-4-amino-4,6-dideoxygalactose transaminase